MQLGSPDAKWIVVFRKFQKCKLRVGINDFDFFSLHFWIIVSEAHVQSRIIFMIKDSVDVWLQILENKLRPSARIFDFLDWFFFLLL